MDKKKSTGTPNTGSTKKKLKYKKEGNPSAPKQKQKMDKRKILNSIIIAFLSIVFIGGVCAFFILFNIISKAPDVSKESLNAKEPSHMLASNGEQVAEIGAESRENIEYEQLPQSTIDAFLSIEDSRFFAHNGFDLPRFLSSAMNNLKSGSLGQGGSTLTMQMIDNVAFKDNVEYDETKASSLEKIEWKIQEIFLSMSIEKEVSKQEILTKYLNKVNFGDSARGIQRGAQYYFGKNVEQLTLSESAFLAGVVNLPNTYNPYKGSIYNTRTEQWNDYYQYAENRRNEVLNMMLYHGYITETECKLAKATELAFQLEGKSKATNDPYRSYIDSLVQEVIALTGDNPNLVSMDIYTGMDIEAQKQADLIIAEQAVQANGKTLTFPEYDNYQAAFVMMNNQDGTIVAIGSGRNYDGSDSTRINYAFEPQQPGSTIKPILDYVPTFDYLGYSTSHTFQDVPLDIYGTGKALKNSSNSYDGDISFADTVAKSRNTTAADSLAKLIDKIGQDKVKDYMLSIGFDQKVVDEFSLQFSIGGADLYASPVQMAAAYSILANGGQYIEPHMVTKIVYKDGSGKVVEPDYTPVQTMVSEQAAYLMSDILNKAVTGGQNYFLSAVNTNYPVYGKTGTSDWGDSGVQYGIAEGVYKDEWMVNYTNKYTIATWEAMVNPEKGKVSSITDAILNANYTGKINRIMLDTIAEQETPIRIAQPSGISTITHVNGKFPYATAEGNADMMTTGLIKSEFAKLSTITADALADLASFTATLKTGTTDTVALNFATYPDAEKLVPGTGKKTYSALGISFTGNLFYDPTRLFGVVGYVADVKVDGKVIQTLDLETNTGDKTITGLVPGKKATICGYYKYKNAAVKSNEVCADIDVPAVTPPVSDPNKPVTDPTTPTTPGTNPTTPAVPETDKDKDKQ